MEPGERMERVTGALQRKSIAQDWDLDSRHLSRTMLTWEQAIRVLRRNRWLTLGLFLGLAVVTLALALLLPDVYRPTARLEIAPLEGGMTTLHEIESAKSEVDQDYLDTQVQILQSEGLAMRVIRALQLDQNPGFVGRPKAGKLPVAPANSAGAIKNLKGGAYLQEQLDLAQTTPAEAEALQTFAHKLLVSPVRGSRLVEVSFASRDPKLAQAVTNTLVMQYMDQNYRNHYMTVMEASDWLSSQLGDLRRRVAQSNQAVADYQKRYGLVESGDQAPPQGQLMGEVSRQFSDAEADRIQAEAAIRLIDAGQTDAIPSFRDDVVYQNLLTHYAEERGQLAETRAVYGDENANVKKLKGEIEELSRQVDAERNSLIKRARSSFEAAKAREQMMAEVRDKLHDQMGSASSHLVEYGTLKNEAGANAALYNTLQARLREAGIYAGLRSGNIRVVDMARSLEKPTGPARGVITAVGLTFSLLFAVALSFVRESFDNTVRIPDDIRDWTRVPSLAVLPKVQAEEARALLPADRNSAPPLELQPAAEVVSLPRLFWSRMHTAEAEAVRTLQAAVLTSSTPAPQVLLVSSPSIGEGKTTVAMNFACVLAQHGKTCLIEGDMRRPTIGSALGAAGARAGLAEVLAGKKTVHDVLVPVPGVRGLLLLPSGAAADGPSDLLASQNLRYALNSLREQFDHVVIDSPPLLCFSDAALLGALSDAVILVSRYGSTTRRAVQRSAELLAEAQAPLLGVVLNGVDLSSPDYHYFNYGYSWAESRHNYQQVYKPFVSSGADEKTDHKSRGAHA